MAMALGAWGAVPAAAQPVLVLHVDDQASVPPHELAAAKAVVERTFTAVGIEILWREGRFPASILGPKADPGRHLAVVLTISGENSTRGAAGCALGFAATRLPAAYAFYNRIVEASRNRPVDLTVVLGRVIAHEIGHLLLPPDSHAAFGIMRPDLDFGVSNPDRFTDDQAQALRAAAVTRVEVVQR
jgi:hypothetical protein